MKVGAAQILNEQVEYFHLEYYCTFLNSINIKSTSFANEFLMHNQQYPRTDSTSIGRLGKLMLDF